MTLNSHLYATIVDIDFNGQHGGVALFPGCRRNGNKTTCMGVVHTLKFCFSHSASTSLRQSLGEGVLGEGMASGSLKRIPREIPRSFHLPARFATADLTSRRSSSPAM